VSDPLPSKEVRHDAVARPAERCVREVTGYRSLIGDPWAWWYRLCVVHICIVFVAIGAALIFGPSRWTRSNSLEVIRHSSHIPWPVWGVGFLLGAALIAFNRTRKGGYLLSCGVAVLFVTASVIWTVVPGKATNPIVIGFSLISPLVFVAGARYVTQQEANREVSSLLDDDEDRGR
jgi:hypothetical protein